MHHVGVYNFHGTHAMNMRLNDNNLTYFVCYVTKSLSTYVYIQCLITTKEEEGRKKKLEEKDHRKQKTLNSEIH